MIAFINISPLEGNEIVRVADGQRGLEQALVAVNLDDHHAGLLISDYLTANRLRLFKTHVAVSSYMIFIGSVPKPQA